MIVCDSCGTASVTFIRYSGQHLCRKHFLEFVEKRFRKELRAQTKLHSGGTIAVAISGGKDSVVLLHLLHKTLGVRPDVRLVGITIDEGIKGYRPSSIDIAARNCEALEIDHRVVRFEDMFGHTMDEVAPKSGKLTPCAYCGVFRRKALNITAKEEGARYLAMGLNLDDTAQSVLMNFIRGDLEKLARLGPHDTVKPGLVPRIQPLVSIPEKECYLYAMLRDIEIHDTECPYSDRALRGRYREVVGKLETETPGTRHSIMKSNNTLKAALASHFQPVELGRCSNCEEPTLHGLCKACEMVEKLGGK